MTEIEQLRKDIATLDAAQKVCFERSWGTIPELQQRIRDKQAELAKLESEAAAKADPWVYAKEQVKHLGNDGRPDIYNYARHLEQRVAELQAELAKRPVVWCMKNNLTGIYGKHFGLDRIALFDIENPEVLAEWQSEPYTGEQK